MYVPISTYIPASPLEMTSELQAHNISVTNLATINGKQLEASA